MAISTYFQDAIDLVDNTKTLVFDSGAAGYGDMEWSYDGLTVSGGSDAACEQGAARLLFAMGFRFYAPNPAWGWVLPASIPTNLSAVKQENWMISNNIWLVYGHSWNGVNGASRATLNNNMKQWQKLNGVGTSVYPAGHRWDNIINTNSAWFAANPQVLSDANSFDLATLQDAVDQTDYNNLVMICAAQLLAAGFNEFNRTNFDPSDGDGNSSDRVFSFTKDVVDQVRAGTSAIGTHPARTGNPNAQIGLYAYAGHRLPPTNTVRPGVYTQVALAFNSTGLSYNELIDQHAAKADAIMVREYLDTQVWSDSRPLVNWRTKRNYFDVYDTYYNSGGIIGANCEYGANWFVNLIMVNCAVRKFTTGVADYETVLDEIVTNIFGGDPKVRELYMLWSEPGEKFNVGNMKRSFDIVSSMADSWYKTYFKHHLVINEELRNLPAQTPLASQTPSDPFPAAFSKMMAHVVAVRDLDILHSYAFMRQQANARVKTNYPDLQYSTQPLYYTDPYLPTDLDFKQAHAAISAETGRDFDLDSADLVFVQGISHPWGNPTPATGFYCEGGASYIYIGPGYLKFYSEAGNELPDEQEYYGRGIHQVYVAGNRIVQNTGGYLFLDCYPYVRKDPNVNVTLGNKYIYVPSRAAGAVDIASNLRVTVEDVTNGVVDIYQATDTTILDTGVLKEVDGLTRGNFQFNNVNRYLSCYPDKHLMPRSIAVEDFPQLFAARTTTSGTDTTAPSTPGTPSQDWAIDDAMGISWTASTDNVGVYGYEVYRDSVFVGKTISNAYVDTGLSPSTSYSYTVKAVDRDGNKSALSGAGSLSTTAADVTAPSVPANVTVSDFTDTTITLSWDASTDAVGVAGYYIYRDTVLIANRSNPEFKDTGLTASTSYDYNITAYDFEGNESAQSTTTTQSTAATTDTTAPTVPTNLAVDALRDNEIDLTWTASTDAVGVTGYNVYVYDSTEADYIYLDTTASTAYTAAGLESGLTYSFKVSAFDAAGNESAQSSAVEGTTT